MTAFTSTIDLDAYFARIGYDGPRTATLDTLRALHLLHPQAIPFENLDPLLGRAVRIDLKSVQAKLVGARRGGYCYEHNLLFRSVLDALGFRTHGLGARVVWGRTADGMPPRTHMLLLVEVDGTTYLADVGFGGMTLSAPLVFEAGREQRTPHEPFRIDAIEDSGYLLQVKIGDEWRPIYRFNLEPQFPVDYEMANYFVATNPGSPFVSTLMVARLGASTRHVLTNRRLNEHGSGGDDVRHLADTAQLRDALENTFHIRLPDQNGDVDPAVLDAMLARLAS
jgi:N-hydroxyarylamine O-acetyltransferase